MAWPQVSVDGLAGQLLTVIHQISSHHIPSPPTPPPPTPPYLSVPTTSSPGYMVWPPVSVDGLAGQLLTVIHQISSHHIPSPPPPTPLSPTPPHLSEPTTSSPGCNGLASSFCTWFGMAAVDCGPPNFFSSYSTPPPQLQPIPYPNLSVPTTSSPGCNGLASSFCRWFGRAAVDCDPPDFFSL